MEFESELELSNNSDKIEQENTKVINKVLLGEAKGLSTKFKLDKLKNALKGSINLKYFINNLQRILLYKAFKREK